MLGVAGLHAAAKTVTGKKNAGEARIDLTHNVARNIG